MNTYLNMGRYVVIWNVTTKLSKERIISEAVVVLRLYAGRTGSARVLRVL